MSKSNPDENSRYRVEKGIDGSWLVVDYGPDRAQRTAIGRETEASAARQEANALSGLDDVTASLSEPSGGLWTELDSLIDDITAEIDSEHNFDHLLAPSADAE